MRTIMLTMILGSVMCVCTSQVKPETRPITNADRCLAVYVEDLGLFSSSGPKLIVTVWGDGKVIWSKNRIQGGRPYYTGNVEPKKIKALITALNHDGVLTDKSLAQVNYGPDHAFTDILIKANRHELKMSSWHEVSEAGGKTVATHAGIESLRGRSLEDVLKEEPEEYQKYRRVWSSVRTRINALIPPIGKPADGEIKMSHGVVSWVEPSNAQQKLK